VIQPRFVDSHPRSFAVLIQTKLPYETCHQDASCLRNLTWSYPADNPDQPDVARRPTSGNAAHQQLTINNKMTTATEQKNPNKALWEKGDFTRLAQGMRKSGETLVSQLGITKDMKVLDLGCGDGTTAIPAAKTGATVVGVDIARNLVDAGNARAQKAGLKNISFHEGDACDLSDLRDNSFDQVVTIFGAMFAPRPADVAKEMVRVTKSGGKITMGNWIPGDPTLVAQILKISSAYTPPAPQGFISPMLWGVDSEVTARFENAGIPARNISSTRENYVFDFPMTPIELVNTFKKYYGPTMNAFEAAEKNGKSAQLQRELEDLFISQNTATGNHSTIPATFLKVTVIKP
jgi:SAM-dependent methyltransferase